MTPPLLCETKDRYITRLSGDLHPDKPGFGETGWIVSEDVNVEHLLNTFTSLDTNSGVVWDACGNFMDHLYWHKPRRTVLGPKIEGLPNDHLLKPECLFKLSRLFGGIGNHPERKRLLTNALQLEKERGNYLRIALTLGHLSDANRWINLHEEGIKQAREALGIYERLGDKAGQVDSLNTLAHILYEDFQLDAAETAAFRAINLVPGKGHEFLVCKSHRFLSLIHRRKGQKEKAIHHHETAISIASNFKWHDQLFWNHYNLAELFLHEDEFDKTNAHIEEAKLHTANNAYNLARAMETQAEILFWQDELEDAKLEVSRALEVFEKLGAANDGGRCRSLLQRWSEW